MLRAVLIRAAFVFVALSSAEIRAESVPAEAVEKMTPDQVRMEGSCSTLVFESFGVIFELVNLLNDRGVVV